MKIYLIRHGETKGNREHRYVGTTDEGLLPEGEQALREKKMPQDVRVYASPLSRCRETARILFPEQEPILIEDLRECDFGEFEYKNYAELNGNPDYQRFIDTMGESGFPGGEDMKSFQQRCVRGFEEVLRREKERSEGGQQEKRYEEAQSEEKQPKDNQLKDNQLKDNQPKGNQLKKDQPDIALVVHGGTIMALLDRFSMPHRDYYDWQVKNGGGYVATVFCQAEGDLLLTEIHELSPFAER